MWAITGIGEAKKRTLSALMVPPVRSVIRRAPPSTGIRLSRRRPDAASQPLRCFGQLRWVCRALGRVMVTWDVIPRCSPDPRRHTSGGRTSQEPYFRLT